MLRYVLAGLAAIAMSLLLVPQVMKMGVRLGIVDRPNERKIHKGEIPRVGGLAIYAGFMAGLLVLGNFSEQVLSLIIAVTIIVGVGFWDDAKNLHPVAKLSAQVIAALIVIQGGIIVEFFTNPITGGLVSLGVFSVPLTVLWLVGISNAINLIDGMDGLSSGVGIISAITIAVINFMEGAALTGGIAVILAASTLGFLRYNFPPAKIFMGDCGSLTLGFILGSLAIMGFSKGATIISVFVPILILGIPILDTFGAIVRRSISHKPVFEADRGHLHHRLLDMGFSQKQVVLIVYLITFLLGMAAILMSLLTTPQAVVILMIVTILVSIGIRKTGVFKPLSSTKMREDH